MPLTWCLILVILGGLVGLALLRGLKMSRRWRVGRPSVGEHWVPALLQLPRRYLRDVHHIVAREPRTARMHAALAGGTLLTVPVAIALTIWPVPALAGLLALADALLIYGLCLQALRRWPQAPARYSRGAWSWLTAAFAGVAVFGASLTFAAVLPATVALPLLLLAALLGAISLGWLAWSVAGGPMRHAVAGSVHLAFHPRRKRFEVPEPVGHADTALRPIDLDASRLGVETAADFAWNQLAGFDACVQCGRCEAVCPAFAAGAPLNPKALIADLSFAAAPPGTPRAYAGSGHPGKPLRSVATGPHAPIVIEEDSGLAGISPDTLWSCTTCRACVEECPMMIEHVDAVIDLRQFETLSQGRMPPKVAETLDNLRMTDTQGGYDPATRLDGLVDLNLPLAAEAPVDTLLWLGEAAFTRRNQRQIRALVRLLRQAGVDFAVQAEELDSGDIARRLGDEAGFQRLVMGNIERLSKLSFNRIVTMDPHVLHVLRREYPAFGAEWQVLHHSELLADLISNGKLTPGKLATRVTYHDPCYLGRYGGQYEAPREILATLGVALTEMDRSGRRSRCCGGGGGAPQADIPGERRIPDMRMEDARETGAETVVVACPFCTQMLEGVTGDQPDVLDIAELIVLATEDAA